MNWRSFEWAYGALLILLCWVQLDCVQAGGLPIEFEVNVEQTELVVGEPLVIDMRVRNSGDSSLDFFLVGGNFALTWYFDDEVLGCELLIAVASPLPGDPPRFFFTWDIFGLQPGETLECQVTYPQTLFPGEETIDFTAGYFIDNDIFAQHVGEFTYTLLPVHSTVPVEVEASVEPSEFLVGEPLVLSLETTNISGDALAPFTISNHNLMQLIGGTDVDAEDCDIFLIELPDVGFDWQVPALQVGESASCTIIFPETHTPGEETLSFFAWIEGAAWENLAQVSYTLLGERPPLAAPVPVPVNSPVWLLAAVLLLMLAGLQRLRPTRQTWRQTDPRG